MLDFFDNNDDDSLVSFSFKHYRKKVDDSNNTDEYACMGVYVHAMDVHATDEQTEPWLIWIEEMMMTRTRSLQRMPSCPQMQKAHPPHPTPHQSLHGMLIQEQGIKTEVQIEQRERERRP